MDISWNWLEDSFSSGEFIEFHIGSLKIVGAPDGDKEDTPELKSLGELVFAESIIMEFILMFDQI